MWIKYSDTELLNTEGIQGIVMCDFGSNGSNIKAQIDDEHSIILFSDISGDNCKRVFNDIVNGFNNKASLIEIKGEHTRRIGTE